MEPGVVKERSSIGGQIGEQVNLNSSPDRNLREEQHATQNVLLVLFV